MHIVTLENMYYNFKKKNTFPVVKTSLNLQFIIIDLMTILTSKSYKWNFEKTAKKCKREYVF